MLLNFGVGLSEPLLRKKRESKINFVDLSTKTETIVDTLPPKASTKTSRLVCLSDLHTLWDHIEVPKGDTLLITGDITLNDKSADFYITEFQKFLEIQSKRFKEVLVIAGNHDRILQRIGKKECQRRLAPATYLENDLFRTVDNISIFGSPWSNAEEKTHTAFQFKDPKESDAFLKPLRDLAPGSVDVVMTHSGGYRENPLKPIIKALNPRINVAGHYHSEYGTRFLGDIAFVNCASVNGFYWPSHPVIVVDIESR